MSPMQNARALTARFAMPALAVLALSAPAPFAQAQSARPPAISFSGYVDADFATAFGSTFKDPQHITGLEVDLTTTVTFSPTVNAVLYTTMNDGAVPAQGAGNTWAPVKFDGATLNWKYDDKTMVYIGDIIQGTGYANYYLNKRTAVVVGEHAVRGAGFSRDGWTVATGVTGMGNTDSTGAPLPTSQWGTFVKYEYPLNERMTLTPSVRYTAGVPGATPVVGGLSFDGTFGPVSLSADAAFNYYSTSTDPGFTVLVEPTYTRDRFTLSASLFLNEWGTSIAPNHPAQTVTGAPLDRAYLYVEPGYALSDRVSVGLPLEFHDAHATEVANLGYDQSVWAVPTLYLYPGANVQWWIWGQVIKPLSAPASKDPLFFAGSELIINF